MFNFLKNNVLTIDNALHVLLGLVVLFLAWLWLPLGPLAALYLREQGQARSWTLKMSAHKHSEYFFPGLVIIAIWIVFNAST